MNFDSTRNLLIKESWNFSGYQEGLDGWPEEIIFNPEKKWFRIIDLKQNPNWKFNINNVKGLGWNVYNYEAEEISYREAGLLIKNSTWDDYYKSYKITK